MHNVLVVDDDQSMLQMIYDALNSDYRVFTAESVQQANDIRRENTIDLLIADLVIPEENGIDMIMEFRKLHPDMRILAISGGGGITGRFDYLPIAKLIGAEDTLKKPFSITELREKARNLLRA